MTYRLAGPNENHTPNLGVYQGIFIGSNRKTPELVAIQQTCAILTVEYRQKSYSEQKLRVW